MSFSADQVKIYDGGNAQVVPVLWIKLAAGDLYLTGAHVVWSVSSATIKIDSAASGAMPCILNWGQTAFGFDLIGEGDSVASLIVTAQNVIMPVHTQDAGIPNPVIRGYLSDYLSTITLAGPGAGGNFEYAPGIAAVFYCSTVAVDLAPLALRHYVFRGLLVDFDVTADGRLITLRFVEDTRWDRPHPHPMSKRNLLTCPQDNVGVHQPLNYGNFGLWAHKDLPKDNDTAKGPFYHGGPIFPVCANLAIMHQALANPGPPYSNHSTYTVGLHNTNSPGIASLNVLPLTNGEFFQAPLVSSETPAMVERTPGYLNGYYGYNTQLSSANGIFATTDQGMHDLKRWSNIVLDATFYGYASLLPTIQIATSRTGATNLDSIFAQVHLKRATPSLIDGDRFTWFKDNVSSTSARRVCFDLGTYPNLGSIISINMNIFGRRRSGSGTLSVTGYLEYYSAAVGGDTGIATTGGMAITPNATTGFFSRAGVLTQVLYSATSAERWEFVQHDTPGANNPMKLVLEWTKSVGSDVWDIIQVCLNVRFNPSRYFLEYRALTDERSGTGYNALGEKYTYSYDYNYLEKVTAAREFQPQRHLYLAGLGQQAEFAWFPGDPAWVGAPSPTIPTIIQNPAEILRHIIYHQGGSQRDDVAPAWPPIQLSDFEYGSGNVYDFQKAEDNLNASVVEASGAAGETFKVAFSIPEWRSVRAAVNSLVMGVPGLRYFRTPLKGNNHSNDLGSVIGCVYPLVGAPVSYRRPVHLRSDAIQFNFSLLPTGTVVNDIKIKYGYSNLKSASMRELWANNNIAHSGWPLNTYDSGAEENESPDNIWSSIGTILEESYQRYGTMSKEVSLPWCYRWHEALAVRNWIIRWYALQRVRINMVCRQSVSDMVPGDVFILDDDTPNYLQGIKFPLRHILNAPLQWGSTTWLAEKIVHQIGKDGELVTTIQAIYQGKLVEV